MATQVKLDWSSVEFLAAEVTSWTALKKAVDLEANAGLLSQRAVYVIRISRPFAFLYGDFYSPVAYIGKGQAQQRLTSHLKSWIPQLAKKIPDLKIKIYFCEPRVRRLGRICEGVEADLIAEFCEVYGQRPLRNRNSPSHRHEFVYAKEDLNVLHPGKGSGYHWGLTPLPSCHFYG